jgi:hypothetical protein
MSDKRAGREMKQARDFGKKEPALLEMLVTKSLEIAYIKGLKGIEIMKTLTKGHKEPDYPVTD